MRFLVIAVILLVPWPNPVHTPILNQSMSYTVMYSTRDRVFQEPVHLRSDKIKWGKP